MVVPDQVSDYSDQLPLQEAQPCVLEKHKQGPEHVTNIQKRIRCMEIDILTNNRCSILASFYLIL